MMKKIIILGSLIWSYYSFSQKASVFIRDLVTNDMDTLHFGYDENATIGIDYLLGEKNIRFDSLKPLDFRILQRDNNDFYCLHPFGGRNVNGDIVYDSVFYSPSFDSKINFRPKDSINRYFEIFMHYQNNLKFTIDLGIRFKYILDKIILYIRPCPESVPIISNSDDPIIGESDVALFHTLDTGYHLIWVFKDSINIPTGNNNLIDVSNLKFYPNPFKDQFSVELSGNYDQLEIIDIYGRSVFLDQNINGLVFYELTTKEWSPGYYFLRILDKERKEVIVKKLVKI